MRGELGMGVDSHACDANSCYLRNKTIPAKLVDSGSFPNTISIARKKNLIQKNGTSVQSKAMPTVKFFGQ